MTRLAITLVFVIIIFVFVLSRRRRADPNCHRCGSPVFVTSVAHPNGIIYTAGCSSGGSTCIGRYVTAHSPQAALTKWIRLQHHDLRLLRHS